MGNLSQIVSFFSNFSPISYEFHTFFLHFPLLPMDFWHVLPLPHFPPFPPVVLHSPACSPILPIFLYLCGSLSNSAAANTDAWALHPRPVPPGSCGPPCPACALPPSLFCLQTTLAQKYPALPLVLKAIQEGATIPGGLRDAVQDDLAQYAAVCGWLEMLQAQGSLLEDAQQMARAGGAQAWQAAQERYGKVSPLPLHAFRDPGAGAFVVVWGPGGQWDTANGKRGGPGGGQGVGWGPIPPPRTRLHPRHYQSPPPLCVPAGPQSRRQRGCGGGRLLRLVWLARTPMLACR